MWIRWGYGPTGSTSMPGAAPAPIRAERAVREFWSVRCLLGTIRAQPTQQVMAIDLQKRMVVEYGIELDDVWMPLAMLRRLEEHGPWNVPFTEASPEQARVLIAHGLAERHNTGLSRGNALRNFVEALPFAPTENFKAIPTTYDEQSVDKQK